MNKINKSIFVIWLFIFLGFFIIVWFGSAFMHKVAERDPKAAFMQGKQLYSQGKMNEAYRKFQITVKSEPTNYLAYYYLAKLSWQKNNAEQTLVMLRKYHHNHLGYIIPDTVNHDLISLCQEVAQYYISQQDWSNARMAYDIAGNSVNNIAEYLQQLEAQYTISSETTKRNKIWPQGIAITLENFESTQVPVLTRWVTNPSASIENHQIVQTPIHSGKQAELLKINYATAGPDYWAKNVYILLQAPLAIRAYVTGKSSTRVQLIANMRFATTRPEQKVGVTGACFSSEAILNENQWVPLIIPDVYTKAMQIAKDPSGIYNPQSIQLEMIAINTFGNDCELYLDDIEVYLPKS